MSIFASKPAVAPDSTAPEFSLDRIELYVPKDLEPYMDTARERTRAVLKSGEARAWITGAQDRTYIYVSRAVVALDYNGIVPGGIPAPDMVSRQVVDTSHFPTPSWRMEWKDDPSMRVEFAAQLAAHRADQAARTEFLAKVEAVVDDVMNNLARANEAAAHFIALEEATHMRNSAREQEAADLARAVQYTDPVTGACDSSHGEILRRSVLPATPGWTWDSWYAVESSAITHLAIQHRLGQRMLEQHPDMAASIDRVVDDMLQAAGL